MGGKRTARASFDAPYVKADYHNLSEKGKDELMKYIMRLCEDEERELSGLMKKSNLSRSEVVNKYFTQNGTYGLTANDVQSTKYWIDVPKKPRTRTDTHGVQDGVRDTAPLYGPSGSADRRMDSHSSKVAEKGAMEEGMIPAHDSSSASPFPEKASYQADEDRNAEFEMSEGVPFYDRSVDSHLRDSEANEEDGNARKAARCFNCGSYSHSLRACQRPRDSKAIAKNKSDFLQANAGSRDNQGENQVRYFNTSAEEFERKEIIKNSRREEILCPLLDGVQPGQLSKDLCVALGMSFERQDPPPWVARMRELGVPPSYKDKKNVVFYGVNAPIPEGADKYMWQNALQSQPAAQDAGSQNLNRLGDAAVPRSDPRRHEFSSPPDQIDQYHDGRVRPSRAYPDSYGRRSYGYEGAGDVRQSPPQHHIVGQSYYEDRIPGLSPSQGSPYYNSPMHSDVYGDGQNWQYGDSPRRNMTPNTQMAYSDVQQPMMAPPGLDRGHHMSNSYSPQRGSNWDQRDGSYSYYGRSTY